MIDKRQFNDAFYDGVILTFLNWLRIRSRADETSTVRLINNVSRLGEKQKGCQDINWNPEYFIHSSFIRPCEAW